MRNSERRRAADAAVQLELFLCGVGRLAPHTTLLRSANNHVGVLSLATNPYHTNCD